MIKNTTLSPAQTACNQGWEAYYAGNLEQAQQQFSQAQEAAISLAPADESVATNIALGFGKVYTRSGHWQTARSWLLYALSLARQTNQSLDSVRGFGALGELFLRANQPQNALFCLNTAHQLLPPGAGERSRQWNYIASALLRLNGTRDLQTAESLLMSSYYLALDSNNASSVYHSLARLQFLDLARNSTEDIVERLQYIEPENKLVDAVPQGFLAMARGFSALQRNDTVLAKQQGQHALHHFRHYDGEYQWAKGFCAFLQVKVTTAEPSSGIPKIETPPPTRSALNHIWEKGILTNTGSAIFMPKALDLPSLISHRQVYFL